MDTAGRHLRLSGDIAGRPCSRYFGHLIRHQTSFGSREILDGFRAMQPDAEGDCLRSG